MLVWLLTCNWDKLTEHFVDLTGKMTMAEKKTLVMVMCCSRCSEYQLIVNICHSLLSFESLVVFREVLC